LIRFLKHAHPHQGRQGNAQLLLLAWAAQPQGLFKGAEAELLLSGELVDQVGDREIQGVQGASVTPYG
jgi:hypothetical protein